MIAPIMAKINNTLSNVSELAFVYDFGVSEIEGYPCAIYVPVEFDNDYFTNEENVKGYKFKIVVMSEAEVKGKRSALHDVLIPTVDAIVSEFDKDWNFGTDADGHRIWSKIEVGNMFLDSDSQDGKLLVAELNLTVNQLSNIN